MKYVLAGGGTGGHINPAIAIAEELCRRDPEAKILFVGTSDGMESTLVPKAGYAIEYIPAHGFLRGRSLRAIGGNIKYAFLACKSTGMARRILRRFGADLVIGTGGYVSGPVVWAAQLAHIPTVIHEQNAFAGVTTRMVAKKANKVFLSFPNTIGVEDLTNTVVTGNPIRGGFKQADRAAARQALGLSDKPMVLSCGGSLGARALNDAVSDMLVFSAKDGQMQHLHATGAVGHDRMMERLAQRRLPIDGRDGITVKEYIYNMSECMAAADVVISRAGAISLAEIAAMGKPSILIPSPNVAENHQYHNACVLRDAGAALLIEEKDLNGESLYAALTEVALDCEKRSRMAKAALTLAHTDAAGEIVDHIEAILK